MNDMHVSYFYSVHYTFRDLVVEMKVYCLLCVVFNSIS